MTGVAKTTILRLIRDLGEACAVYHDKHVRGLIFFQFNNYCRVLSTLGTSPAVASGLADHVWSLDQLIRLAD